MQVRKLLSVCTIAALAVTMAPAAFSAPAPKPTEQMNNSTRPVAIITGLDGATYEAYMPSIVKKVQQALKDKDLYNGEVNGKLNKTTMEAIAAFQKKNHLEASGVPTPDTRDLLFKG